VFAPPHPEDSAIPPQIAEAIYARLQSEDMLVCQLAVGSHVDHFLVRQGLELLGYPLRYDIDVPYIFYKSEQLEPKAAGMKESIHSITETGLDRWKDAAAEYKSQFVGLGEAFDTREKAQAAIHAYWAERKGIRMYQKE
jgi:hypothetical protein